MKTTKVAIIGSNSFAAGYIISQLKSSCFLTGFSRVNNNPNLYNHILFDFPTTSLDFSNLLDFDCIIYAAGAGIQSNLKDSVFNIYELNCFLPIQVFNYLESNQFKGTLITFGSYAEIGTSNSPIPYVELSVVSSANPIHNQYGISKRLLTRFISDQCASFNYYHLILPTIYGKGENPLRLIPYLVNSLQNNTPIHLTDGNQVRQYLHCKDLANLIEKIIKDRLLLPSGIYNIPCFETLTVRQVVETVMNKMSINTIVEFGRIQRADQTLPFLVLNTDKLTQRLYWKPTISINDSISDYQNDER